MAETTYFPRRLILAGAMVSGVLLALAVHMLGARYGLDLGGLWRSDTHEFMPAGAAIAWWLIATMGFSGGYFTATLMHSAVSGQIPQRMRQFLIAVGVLVLAGAGQAHRPQVRPRPYRAFFPVLRRSVSARQWPSAAHTSRCGERERQDPRQDPCQDPFRQQTPRGKPRGVLSHASV